MPDKSSADELADRAIKRVGQLAAIGVPGFLETFNVDVPLRPPRLDE